MTGKLIVIEGSDGSGKQTQSALLYESLKKEGKDVKLISFPNYESQSSSLVKMYLNGDFGLEVEDVNIYASSMFYAVDRFSSFNTDWKDFYENGGIVIADRYTTANMIHQAVKITNKKEKNKYLDWLWDLEFNKFELPQPDNVIFLDVKPEVGAKLMENRNNKITNTSEKDIHERNGEYMKNCYDNSLFISDKYDWDRINCCRNDEILTIEEIQGKIRKVLDV